MSEVVMLPVCQERHAALDDRVDGLDERVCHLETKTEGQDKRLLRVEVLLEAQARNVKDMAEIQKDNMKWYQRELSAKNRSDAEEKKRILNFALHMGEIALIVALTGKLVGVY